MADTVCCRCGGVVDCAQASGSVRPPSQAFAIISPMPRMGFQPVSGPVPNTDATSITVNITVKCVPERPGSTPVHLPPQGQSPAVQDQGFTPISDPGRPGSTPVVRPSPEPFAILSPMPDQGFRPISDPAAAPSQALCTKCASGVEQSPTRVRRPSPEPFQILSPMPDEQGFKPVSDAGHTEPDSRPESPRVRRPSPEPFQILSPMPDQESFKPVSNTEGSAPPSRPESPSVRLPTPEPYAILSPMPGQESFKPVSDPAPVSSEQPMPQAPSDAPCVCSTAPEAEQGSTTPARLPSPEPYPIISPMQDQGSRPASPVSQTQSQGPLCSECVAEEVEHQSVAELRNESPTFDRSVTSQTSGHGDAAGQPSVVSPSFNLSITSQTTGHASIAEPRRESPSFNQSITSQTTGQASIAADSRRGKNPSLKSSMTSMSAVTGQDF